ncbi:29143_t:CDS:1, partial [Gigaspora margarita]
IDDKKIENFVNYFPIIIEQYLSSITYRDDLKKAINKIKKNLKMIKKTHLVFEEFNNPFIYRKFMELIPKIREGDKKNFLILWSNVLLSVNQKRVAQNIQFNDRDKIA